MFPQTLTGILFITAETTKHLNTQGREDEEEKEEEETCTLIYYYIMTS